MGEASARPGSLNKWGRWHPRQIEREDGTRMAQSQNSSVYYTEKATSFHGLGTYGTVMLGLSLIHI